MVNKNKTIWSNRFRGSTSKSFQRIGASINVDKDSTAKIFLPQNSYTNAY